MTNPAIRINAQYLKDLSFENPKILDLLAKPLETPPGCGVEVEINAKHLGETTFEVTLNMRVDTRVDNDSPPLSLLEIAYAGVFTIPQTMSDDQKKQAILVDCPSLLFPFVRSLVVDITKESGVLPLTLAPIDFYALYEQKISQEKAEGKNHDAGAGSADAASVKKAEPSEGAKNLNGASPN